ncbi:MAG: DMT family transporter, partial [bacterium]
AAMALQGSLNSALGKIIGLWEATLLVHIIGTATVGAVILFTPLNQGDLTKLGDAPWYTLLGGVLSVAIIALVATSIPRLGVAVATTAIIVAQVSTALLIDHLGLFGLQAVPFTWLKLVGMVLLAGGALLMLYR